MNSDDKGNNLAHEGKASMTADYGQRAANAIDLLVPGPHRDKEIARKFGISVRMAKYLRAGKHWTADRLTQASSALGVAFDMALSDPASAEEHYAEMKNIAERLARLEKRFEKMDSGEAAGLASAQGSRIDRGGREAGFEGATSGHGGPRA